MTKRFSVVALVIALMVLVAGCPKKGGAQLLSVVPNVIAEGAQQTQLVIKGTGFVAPAIVGWQEGSTQAALATTLVSSTELTAEVPASLLTTAGVAEIAAQVGTGGNQTATASLSIVISNSAPTLTGAAPLHAIVGASATTVTLTGTNFNSSSVANWNGTAVATTFVSATSLTAVIPATDLTTAGTDKITVSNPGTGGGTTSAENFIVVAQLAITTASLPGGSLGVAYSATLAATGGQTPYTWSVSAGSLPAGLSLSSAGVISGTPTAPGTASFTVQVVDSTGALARRTIR